MNLKTSWYRSFGDPMKSSLLHVAQKLWPMLWWEIDIWYHHYSDGSHEFSAALTITSGAGACPSMQQRRSPVKTNNKPFEIGVDGLPTDNSTILPFYQCPSIKTVGECWFFAVWRVWLLVKDTQNPSPLGAAGCPEESLGFWGRRVTVGFKMIGMRFEALGRKNVHPTIQQT